MPFSFRRLSKTQLLALCVVLVGTITTLGLSSRRWLTNTKEMKPVTTPQAKNKANPLGKGYLQRKGIWPQLRSTLDAHGDRFEKPGKERLIITGNISDPTLGADEKTPSRLIFEFPDKLRLEKQKKEKLDVTIFDGKTKFKIGGALKKEEENELESLVLDSADHFLAGHMQGFAMRSFGSRFRLDDGSTPNYTGPFYDIYQLTDQIPDNNSEKSTQPKRYFINSHSQLMERVTYQDKRNGGEVEVTVQFSDWQKVNGQQIPTKVTRTENGKAVSILTITTATLSPRTDDGIFTNK